MCLKTNICFSALYIHKTNAEHGHTLFLTSADQEEESKPNYLYIKQTEIDFGSSCFSLLTQRQHFGHLKFLKLSVRDLGLNHELCSNDFIDGMKGELWILNVTFPSSHTDLFCHLCWCEPHVLELHLLRKIIPQNSKVNCILHIGTPLHYLGNSWISS